jgi:hypothetical protein
MVGTIMQQTKGKAKKMCSSDEPKKGKSYSLSW